MYLENQIANKDIHTFSQSGVYVMEQKKRVNCLYRVSTIGQVEKDDIPMQRQFCREFIASHPDWVLQNEFYEKGVSGFKKSAKERDAMQELQQEAVAGSFDILLVYMFDRLGRRDDETPFVVDVPAREILFVGVFLLRIDTYRASAELLGIGKGVDIAQMHDSPVPALGPARLYKERNRESIEFDEHGFLGVNLLQIDVGRCDKQVSVPADSAACSAAAAAASACSFAASSAAFLAIASARASLTFASSALAAFFASIALFFSPEILASILASR